MKYTKFFVQIIILILMLSSCGKESISRMSFLEDGIKIVYLGNKESKLKYLICYDSIVLSSSCIDISNGDSAMLPKLKIKDVLKRIDTLAYSITKSGFDYWDVHYKILSETDVVLVDSVRRYYINDIKSFPISNDGIYAKIVNSKFGLLERSDYLQFHRQAKTFLVNNNIKLDNDFAQRMAYNIYMLKNNGKEKQLTLKQTEILNTFPKSEVTINTNMNASYFYLLAVNDENDITDFVKSEIINDFTKGIPNNIIGTKEFSIKPICNNWFANGYLYIFLIGIDEEWHYEYYPVGGIIIDNIAPELQWENYQNSGIYNIINTRLTTRLRVNESMQKFKDYYIDFYEGGLGQQSIIRNVTWGNFEGNDYSGYPITLTINIEELGDLESIILQNKIYKVDRVEALVKKRFVFEHHFSKLKVGDNYFQIKFVDTFGNTCTGKINITTERVKNDGIEINNNIFNDIY